MAQSIILFKLEALVNRALILHLSFLHISRKEWILHNMPKSQLYAAKNLEVAAIKPL
jgi:hypothetical protein